ncbi:hypothetical protein Lal_00014691 [Lupinus albus]|nr:hypothetical protein Lal_00014691 [Lupinus albus]
MHYHEYELFRMFPREYISDMQKRSSHIVNHLVASHKVFAIGELTSKEMANKSEGNSGIKICEFYVTRNTFRKASRTRDRARMLDTP